LKCCVDISQRPDKVRGVRESTTSSARAERVAQRPPHALVDGGRDLLWMLLRRSRRHLPEWVMRQYDYEGMI